jgi:hypothetical protein
MLLLDFSLLCVAKVLSVALASISESYVFRTERSSIFRRPVFDASRIKVHGSGKKWKMPNALPEGLVYCTSPRNPSLDLLLGARGTKDIDQT